MRKRIQRELHRGRELSSLFAAGSGAGPSELQAADDQRDEPAGKRVGGSANPAGGVGLPAVGPLSALVAELLSGSPQQLPPRALVEAERLIEAVHDPLSDDDLQLALYLCLELHYRSFPGIDPAWEWDLGQLALRARLERAFIAALEAEVGPGEPVDPEGVGDLLFRLEAGDEGVSLSRRLELDADLEQLREFVVHRSLYQLKEADPHSWAIPRLDGAAKTALLEVQGDEYGSGRPDRMHSVLFAKTMRALGLDDRENAYLDRVPGPTLATVNLMSAMGLRRERRGAIVGHLAMFEMTSAQPNRRYGNALRRLGFGPEATDFYDEHVEADAVHENIAAYDLAGGLARQEPELAWDIVFGARALLFLDDRFARHLLAAWEAGETSLRRSL
jgi:hypothetical protein